MTETVENPLPEHMKRSQATLERMERRLEEHSNRLSSLEGGQAAIVQHLAHFSAAHASKQVQMDHVQTRLDRMERRLELTD